jgi:hypothetical protein
MQSADDTQDLTPRMRRIVTKVAQKHSEPPSTICRIAMAMGMLSVLTATIFWDSAEEFMQAACQQVSASDQQYLDTLWAETSAEADLVVAALARVRLIAQRYAPNAAPTVTKTSQATVWAALGAVLPVPGTRRKRTAKPALATITAASAENRRLEEALQMAFAIADEIGDAAARLLQLQDSILPEQERRQLLRNLFMQKAKVPSTMRCHIRAICRLRTWAAGKGLDPWRLKPVELAYFLRDASLGRLSVPRMLLSGLDWLHTALQLPWKLDDAAVQSVAKMSAAAASAARLQAEPYTHQVVLDLLTLLGDGPSASDTKQQATTFTILFLLCLAFACLRFSDLDRSTGLSLGRDAIHAVCWRSKGKPAPIPWAALRRTWAEADWGGLFFSLVQDLLPHDIDGQPRDWLWPSMVIANGVLELVRPVRHGSYSNCLMAMSFVHRIVGHSVRYTLHSPRFFICGIAGQAGFTLEERRSMGRWGPTSGMPIRYDQSRCCSELASKQKLWQQLREGLNPGEDYELPCFEMAGIEFQARASQARHAKEMAACPPRKCPRTEPSEADDAVAVQSDAKRILQVLINHKTGVLHLNPPCQNVRDPGMPHYETTVEDESNLHLYQRCVTCFCKDHKHLQQFEMPQWSDPGEESGSSAHGSDPETASASSESDT